MTSTKICAQRSRRIPDDRPSERVVSPKATATGRMLVPIGDSAHRHPAPGRETWFNLPWHGRPSPGRKFLHERSPGSRSRLTPGWQELRSACEGGDGFHHRSSPSPQCGPERFVRSQGSRLPQPCLSRAIGLCHHPAARPGSLRSCRPAEDASGTSRPYQRLEPRPGSLVIGRPHARARIYPPARPTDHDRACRDVADEAIVRFH